jgi:hypothetical protein
MQQKKPLFSWPKLGKFPILVKFGRVISAQEFKNMKRHEVTARIASELLMLADSIDPKVDCKE